FPFAYLTSDIQASRFDAIDAALDRPGKEGIIALMALRQDQSARSSSLIPPRGLPAIDEIRVPQEGVPMAERRAPVGAGARLRAASVFQGPPPPEAAGLCKVLGRAPRRPGRGLLP